MSKKIYGERAIQNLPECQSILRLHPEIEWIDDYQTFRKESPHREKECIVFAQRRGAWLKPFHCYQHNPEFTYYSLDVAEGCLFDCVYCYLQSYLNHGALVLFVNYRSIQHELERLQGRNLWISTGLLSDSLLAEKHFPILPELSRWVPPGSILEFRTKSDDLTPLAEKNIRCERIVVSWSVNPKLVAENYEYRTPSIERRLNAAFEAIDLGYRIGLHLDPVFDFPGWKEEYASLFDKLRSIRSDRIAFFSVGLFRYMPELGAIIRNRFPYHPILSGEFFPDIDGKYHYFRPIRKEMYEAFSEWLKPWRNTPIFWSMEPDKRLLV